MCLILFALNQHPQYNLIIAANRDEFYNRPTADAHFWDDHPHVLAGRDLSAHGTWMGVNKFGRVAMLTNYRDMKTIRQDAPSRGGLVADFLIEKEITDKEYLGHLYNNGRDYNGFNLLFGNREKLNYYSNISEDTKHITSGFHGLSNHFLNTGWHKVERGKVKLSAIINSGQAIDPEALLEVLYDDIKAPDHMLPDTGVGVSMERMLSPIFIKSADYGSRCSTVVLADKDGHWTFYERVYNVKDFTYGTNTFRFREVRNS